MATLFVNASYVKRFTPLGDTVDENSVMPAIMVAQDRQIMPILGTDLYNKLVSDIDGDTVSGAYTTLLKDYISPCLAQFAFCELAYTIRLRFANNTVTVGDSEQGQAATIADIKLAVEKSEGIAAFYRQRIIDYLVYNKSSFPEYTSNTGADLQPTRNNYFQGLNVYETKVSKFPKGTFDS